jgi:hypothetical protein
VIEGTTRGDSALHAIAIMNGPKPRAMDVTRIPQYDTEGARAWRGMAACRRVLQNLSVA